MKSCYSLFMAFVLFVVNIFSNDTSQTTKQHHRNPSAGSYQLASSRSCQSSLATMSGNIQQGTEESSNASNQARVSLKELWKMEKDSLEVRNRVSLWAAGNLDDSELRDSDLAQADIYETEQTIYQNYPVGEWLWRSFMSGMLGGVVTAYILVTQQNIAALTQTSGQAAPSSFAPLIAGGGISVASFSKACRNARERCKKINRLKTQMKFYGDSDEHV
ncbi:hypothetical protein A3F66_00685 [candidate division TM6 bacterium RIFCSPHIGHO2_12_FULL_32_22]|nr:MAG: hypothetical protein A3F66_00685 [candidate division TM6 bacterium RIFCSPHIGHO2_12_FULL_32_22]